MEQTFTFVLGAISALGIISLGYAFIQVLKINRTVKSLQTEIEETQREIDEIHKRMESKFEETNKEIHDRIDQTTEELRKSIDELYRYVDSRFDKQATKAADVISTSYRNTYEKVEKLEELFKLQMDQFAKVTLNHSERLSDLETKRKIEEDKIEQINS